MTRITKNVGRFGEFHIEFVTNLPSFQKVGKVWWNRIHIDCFFCNGRKLWRSSQTDMFCRLMLISHNMWVQDGHVE